MQLSWADLSPAVVEKALRQGRRKVGAYVARQLVKCWRQKAAGALGTWPPKEPFKEGKKGAKTIKIIGFKGSEGVHVGSKSKLSPRWENAAPDVRKAVAQSMVYVRVVVGSCMQRGRIEWTRKWLLEQIEAAKKAVE